MKITHATPQTAAMVETDNGSYLYAYIGTGNAGLHLPEGSRWEPDDRPRQEFWTPNEMRDLAAALHWAADYLERHS